MNEWLMVRRLWGPAFLVLLGTMFLLAEFHIVPFHRSWPLLLILAGVLKLAERAALSRIDPAQDPFHAAGSGAYPGYPAAGVAAPGAYGQTAPAGTGLTVQHPLGGTTSDLSSDSKSDPTSGQGRS